MEFYIDYLQKGTLDYERFVIDGKTYFGSFDEALEMAHKAMENKNVISARIWKNGMIKWELIR